MSETMIPKKHRGKNLTPEEKIQSEKNVKIYQNDYQRQFYTRYSFRLRYDEDKDLLEFLEAHKASNSYLRELIVKDFESAKSEVEKDGKEINDILLDRVRNANVSSPRMFYISDPETRKEATAYASEHYEEYKEKHPATSYEEYRKKIQTQLYDKKTYKHRNLRLRYDIDEELIKGLNSLIYDGKLTFTSYVRYLLKKDLKKQQAKAKKESKDVITYVREHDAENNDKILERTFRTTHAMPDGRHSRGRIGEVGKRDREIVEPIKRPNKE